MCSNDVEPNRLAVAQEATRRFVEKQPKDVRMGLVVFSGFAELVVPPTNDRDALVEAIDTLTVGRGTAIGAALLKGVDAIAEVNPGVAPVGDAPELQPEPQPTTPGVGSYVPDIVVLLTDGRNTRGIEPLDAVPMSPSGGFASTRSVSGRRARAIGRARASSSAATSSTGSEAAGSGWRLRRRRVRRRGFGRFLIADHPTLKEIATRTGGSYYAAKDADQLQEVFSDLPNEVLTQRERREVTWMLAALGALLAAGAVAASMRWSPYP